METQQEKHIIQQAQDILARRMGVSEEIKLNLRNLLFYSAYYQGARIAAEKLAPNVLKNFNAEDKVYIKAEIDLITSSKRNMQLWLDGTEMRYRNHKRKKKGKLESCECYFVEYRNVIQEVK